MSEPISDRGVQAGDVVRLAGFDRTFIVGGVNDKGTHPDTFASCKTVNLSMQAFGGRGWRATYPEDEVELVCRDDDSND